MWDDDDPGDKSWRDPNAKKITFDEMTRRAQYEWQRAEETEAEVIALHAALAARDARIAELEGALRSVIDACDSGRMAVAPGKGIGGMTIEANIRGSVINFVPAWPVEEARAALEGTRNE